ncbi:Zn-ribbon domain-containing OB-fold protein [Desulfoscipio gibsoniae]|uniref:Putative nucleic-acid-binding protein containing a Zn-ribbon n=1 Tax=Desulfoscipio gibsoniae DSM 7213 TaxID=767817 RepID=R4KJH8_9FIRM|nr:zinc ribbon domain-containing protein [Desulfoscipio gibsoniae]AGL00675.1 putative nucleic-acid-binding protein containing a Zn-ribbon [Desulfoscipio gibsoniae DSM 7213]
MTTNYVATIDPFPHQSPKLTKMYPFYDHLRKGRLVTTQCRECRHTTWPPKTICPACASAGVEWVDLPEEGTVIEYTIAERGIPAGFSIPTIFVLVQIGPVRILSRLIDADPDQVETGISVKPAVVQVPGTPYDPERFLPVFKLKTK